MGIMLMRLRLALAMRSSDGGGLMEGDGHKRPNRRVCDGGLL